VSTISRASLNKVYETAAFAISDIPDGATLLVGGYAGHAEPETLLGAIIAGGKRDLTVICQGSGPTDHGRTGISSVVEAGSVRRMISPLPFNPREDGPVKRLWQSGQLELEVQPAGVLAERIRAGGAGIGGFYLPTGAGTRFAEGCEVRLIDGREHIFRPALKADFALLRASVADTLGNLVYEGTGRNWNPVMAMAAGVTIAEVDEILEPGGIDPEIVITPAIFVHRIVTAPSNG
jgi:3-oxoadipate CoA-transferase alpha subunit